MNFASESAWWPYLVILVGGWLATDIWRYLGVAVASRVDEDSPVFLWVKAVATALVAGLIARLILFPVGSLAAAPVALRLLSVAAGAATFLLLKRSVFIGLVAAEAVFILGMLIL